MNTIALFGGSFDPPHIGHIAIIETLKALPFIDKVIVMPAYLNPFKSNFTAPAEMRLQWLRDIFYNDEKVEINDYEVSLQKATPTIETVSYLKQFYEKIYVVIGADNLKSLHKWHKYDKLKDMVNFIVVTRGGVDIPEGYLQVQLNESISSTELREKLNPEKLPQKYAQQIQKFYKEHNEKQN